MEEKYTWNFKDIYKDEKELEENIKKVKAGIEKIVALKGKLHESSDNLYKLYLYEEETSNLISTAYGYAYLKYSQNMADEKNIKILKKIEDLYTDYSSAVSFIEPEICKIDDEVLIKFIDENDDLKVYERTLKQLMKDKKHILSDDAEYVLSKFGNIFGSFSDIFDILNDVDFDFGEVTDSDGKKIKLTHGTYIRLLDSKDESVRKEAFEKLYEVYKKYSKTLTKLYLTNVEKSEISAKLRNYSSCLEAATDNDDSNVKVYDSLIKSVNENLDKNYRYMKLKKKMLGKEKLHMYDVYVNPLDEEKTYIDYEEAKKQVLKAVEPLGKEYNDVVKTAMENRWIDVFETENKASGGYSLGIYDRHPYILLNYVGDEDSVSTLAHELGHTMHSYLSSKHQRYEYSEYTMLVAEVASTVNEILFAEYMIRNEKDDKKKAIIINSLIDRIRATLIRQTMFAEFERDVHDVVNKGETLSSEQICDMYYKINQKYFGDDVISDDYIRYEWARIPHFYRNFYVYTYATGISSAIAIASNILSGESGYAEKYLNMLSQGGAKDSLDLLKSVGVDLETTKPVEDALNYYNEKIEQLEKLVEKF